MTRRALITGATGFVGRILAAHLEARDWEVVRVGFPPDETARLCDVRDPENIAKVLDGVGEISHVFHLAAIAFVPDAMRDPTLAMDVNLLGTVRLASALLERHPKARLLNVTSSEVYGPPQRLPIDESHPLAPVNPYAISKTAADQYCAYLAKATDLDVVCARPFNHSGPGQSNSFVLSSFACQVADIEAGRGEPVLNVGNLEAARDFLHVNDVVRAYELLALKGRPGEAYNIASGRAISISRAVEVLLQSSRVPIEVRQDPQCMRPVDVPELYGSHEKLSQNTGWEPETPFENILQDLLDYWRRQ